MPQLCARFKQCVISQISAHQHAHLLML